MIAKPYPGLQDLLEDIGYAGKRMSEIDACEGAAGNISVCLRWEVDIRDVFPMTETVDLPQPAPGLEGATMIVSGSGCRLHELIDHPEQDLACLVVDPGGRKAQQSTAVGSRLRQVTTEFNSHLAVHDERLQSGHTNFNAIIHAQPPYLTYLSHIPVYQDARYLNLHLLRWQPETILNLPEGLGLAPFIVPGSAELARVNAGLFRKHRVVVWARHGVMACSDVSVKHACDQIEYAEASARYEYLNLACGEKGTGLSGQEIRAICEAKNVRQDYF